MPTKIILCTMPTKIILCTMPTEIILRLCVNIASIRTKIIYALILVYALILRL